MCSMYSCSVIGNRCVAALQGASVFSCEGNLPKTEREQINARREK